MTDFERARKGMVDTQLRTNNVTDRRILAVMGRVPRELFVPEARREVAYIDDEHRLNEASPPRYLSAPTPFGRLVQLAEIGPAARVLDVGIGTGYSTAVLAGLAGTVVGVEADAELAKQAAAVLTTIGAENATVVHGPLEKAVAGAEPFNATVIEGAVEAVPEVLFEVLAEGGRLVALLRRGPVAVAHLYVRTGKSVAARPEFNASLPPLEMERRPAQFVF